MVLSLKRSKKDSAEAEKKQVRPNKRALRGGKKLKTGKPGRQSGGKSFVLIIGDEGAILVYRQGRRVLRRLFAPSPQPSHSEAMVEIISANPQVPIYILADVLDQQYVPQTFPPVSALSVGGLVKRRLDRDFSPDDFKGSIQLGRDKAGRKEWKYLLVSLAKTPLLTEWLDCVIELPNELKGIYLTPVEAVNYISEISMMLDGDKPGAWQLLISHNKVSGFRQVVIHDKKLVFTRVSQAIDDAIPAVIAGNIEQEIINTLEYLKRLGVGDSSQLEVMVVISQDVIETLDLKRFGFARARALTPLEVAEALGLEQAALSADRFGDVVMACAFGVSKKKLLRFSNNYINRLAKLYAAEKGIKIVSILFSLGLLGIGAMSAVEAVGNFSSISQSNKRLSLLQVDIQNERRKVAGLNKNITFKSAVVSAHNAFVKNIQKPDDFASILMPLIEPNHRVVSMQWRNEKSLAEWAAIIASSGANAGAPPPQSPSVPTDDKSIKVSILMDFSGGGLSQSVVDKAANDFVEKIKKRLPAYEITHEKFPWLEEQQDASQESLDLTLPQEKQVSQPRVKFDLLGIKPVDPSAAAQPSSVGAP